jgi:hypothetical protein
VVVDAETTETSQVTANPNGTFTLTESSAPVRVQQGGSWVPVSTDLSRRADGTVAPAATATGVVFSGGGNGAMATLAQGGDQLSFTFPEPLPRPTLSGGTAIYPDVLPSVDLRLTADATGFSEILVIKDRAAAASPALAKLTVGLRAQGVQVKSLPDGTAEAVSSSGATIFHSDEAMMWDSTGIPAPGNSTPATSAPATSGSRALVTAAAAGGPGAGAHRARVGVVTSGTSESLAPDQTLLTASDTKYPVYEDPTWSGNPSQQDWARLSSNGWNEYNTTSTDPAAHPRAGFDGWPQFGGGNEVARTYYQMSTGGNTGITGIGGAVVTHADFMLNDDWAASSANTPVDLYQACGVAANAWNSSGMNWNNKPCQIGSPLGELDSQENSNGTVSPGTFDFDITGIARSAASGNWANITFEVRAPNEGDNTQWKQFQSGGGAVLSATFMRVPDFVNGTGNPVTTPSSVDGNVTFTTTHTPTLNITAEDTDGEPVATAYQVWNVVAGTPTTLAAAGEAPSSSTYAPNGGPWTTPSLPDGNYAWRASATNPISPSNPDGLWTGYNPWQFFTVDTTTPNPPVVQSPQFPASMYGAVFSSPGTFQFSTDQTDDVMGYMFSLDSSLASTVYHPGAPPPTWTGSGPAGHVYWSVADNGSGSQEVNGFANAPITPGTVGAHRLYVKAVDRGGNTSGQTTYSFYAGITPPVYVYGDQLANGYTAADGTVVPAATWKTKGAVLGTQRNCCSVGFADGEQAYLQPGTVNAATVYPALGDTATMSFDVPSAGLWDIGANLTTSQGYGQFTLTVDQGTPNAATLVRGLDEYNTRTVVMTYRDFGIPKRDTGGALDTLAAGVHTLTITMTGTDAGSGYKAGIDVLRLAPVPASCPMTDLTACENNTAITADSQTDPGSADGNNQSFSAASLQAAGWAPGAAVTVDGAPMTLPNYGPGKQDNVVADGQTITVRSAGLANDGDAVMFLGFATGGGTQGMTGATGQITYATNCGTGSQAAASQDYELDDIPDWLAGPASAASVITPYLNVVNNGKDTTQQPRLSAMAVPLLYPGCPVASVTLPVVSYGVSGNVPALHIMAVGIRASSYAGATSTTGSGYANASNWTGTFGAEQDGTMGALGAVTLRMPAQVSLGNGSSGRVRVKLSNAMGTGPVTIDDASLATQANGAAPTASPVPLTFNGGSKTVTIPAGGEITADPLAYTVAQQGTLLVSVHLASVAGAWSVHVNAGATSYLSTAGTDAVLDKNGAAFTGTGTSTTQNLPYLAEVDVISTGADTTAASPTGSLVLYGDQTVNADTATGYGAGTAADITADLASANSGTVPYGVLSAGSSSAAAGGNLLPPAVNGDTAPLSARNPMDRSILTAANVRTVLVSSGASDIKNGADAGTVINDLTALITQLRSFYTDDVTFPVQVGNNPRGQVTVYVATIPADPSFTSAEDNVRQQVNQLILGSGGSYLGGNADGVIDFAGAVSADGTDTGSTVKPADLAGRTPDNAYYADLANAYLTGTGTTPGTTTIGVSPNVARTSPLLKAA